MIIDFEPKHVELLQHLGNPHAALGFEMEVDVQFDVHIRADGIPKRADKGFDVPEHRGRNHLVGGAGSAGNAEAVD